jgi:hypothetical protein
VTVLTNVTTPSMPSHATLTRSGDHVLTMITHRMKIRRHLRSARVAALTSEERRQELREAERRNAQDGDRSAPDARDSHPGARTHAP